MKAVVKKDTNTDNEDDTTQVILNTHDPLVIGSMDKNQVRIFKRDSETGKITAEQPDISPKGLGVAGILTSELFGLPTILDKETQEKLNRKRFLQGKLIRNDITEKEIKEYNILRKEMEELGYYEQIEDAMFRDYIAEMSKFEIFQKVEFTDDEQKFLQQESKRVIEQILKKNNKI